MPAPRTELTKQYWTVGEVGQEINRAPSWVRYWCDQLFEDMKRGKKKHLNGNRLISNNQKKLLFLVSDVHKLGWFTVDGMKQLINRPMDIAVLSQGIYIDKSK